MGSLLSSDQITQLAPLLGSLARLTAQGAAITEPQMTRLLLAATAPDTPEVRRELQTWAHLLQDLRDDSAPDTRHTVVESLLLRGLPEATVLLAVDTVVGRSAAAARAPGPGLTAQPERLEWTLAPGQGAAGAIDVQGGPGQVVVDSDQVQVSPREFGPGSTRLQVIVRPVADGIVWTSIKLITPGTTLEIPVMAQWTGPTAHVPGSAPPPQPARPVPPRPPAPAPRPVGAPGGYATPAIPPVPAGQFSARRETPVPPATISCGQCGRAIGAGAQFCPHCGARAGAALTRVAPTRPVTWPTPPAPAVPAPVPARGNAGRAVLALLGILVLGVALLALLGGRHDPPSPPPPTVQARGGTAIPTGTAEIPGAGPGDTFTSTPVGQELRTPAGAPTTVEAPTATGTAVPPAAVLEIWPPASGQKPQLKAVGEPAEQAGMALDVTRIDVRAESSGEDAAARVSFRLFNKTGQRVLVDIDRRTIHVEDNLGGRYVDWDGNQTTSQWVETGTSLDFDRFYSVAPGKRSRIPTTAAQVQVVVDQFSHITNTRWGLAINPALTALAAPASAKAVGDTWEQDGLALTLKTLEVRAESDSTDAAAQAAFTLANQTNTRLLVEVDFAHLYLLDSQGRRFSDADGGGVQVQSLDPGQHVDFARYYSEMAGGRSRITRGATYVAVVATGISRVSRAYWKTDIVWGPSIVPAPGSGATHAIGDPWEQGGMALDVTRVDVRAESSGEDAAARVSFRLFNKTGQRLLVGIDRRTIHLEDNLGGRYVDWDGNQTTAQWLEPGASLDFDRFYSIEPGKRSRVPAGATAVQVVVDTFNAIMNARWGLAINPVLTPLAAPASAKAVGDTWEQNGLALTLKTLEVRAESDSSDAAAQAVFTLANQTNTRLLVEVDFAHLYLLDSQGRRFSDADGGGDRVLWVDPGQHVDFDRYYSEMAGGRSRITRGAAFVVLHLDKLGSLAAKDWRADIVR